MDLDRNGRLDVITGSWPGELYMFSRLEDGSFAKATKLTDKTGETINLGKASAVFAADWDGDGDLDLAVGDQKGHVWWMPNESDGEALQLGAAEKLRVGDEEIRVPHGDAGPCLADWDGNGTLDLIVGCGDGSVRLYSNKSRAGMPVLAEPIDLLARPKGGMGLQEGAPLRTGARTKPCVTDWNGDGRLDLLVGDVLSVRPEPRVLTAEQQDAHDKVQARMAWVQERYRPASERVMRQAIASLGVETEGRAQRELFDSLTDEQREDWGSAYQEAMKKDIEARALQRMLQQASRALQPFRTRSKIHGHVWVLLRQDFDPEEISFFDPIPDPKGE